MSEGWKLDKGSITDWKVSEEKLEFLFMKWVPTFSHKNNTYKYALMKSILDNLDNSIEHPTGTFISYENLFDAFIANYWDMVVKDKLMQTKNCCKNIYSKLEIILNEAADNNPKLRSMNYCDIPESLHDNLLKNVTKECSTCVIGALYSDFEGLLYSFDLKGPGITIPNRAYYYLVSNKTKLIKLDLFYWFKYVDALNSPEKMVNSSIFNV